MKNFLLFTLMLACTSLSAQDIIGTWKTIDDESGKPRSVVEIYEKDGAYFGKIIKLFREPGEDPDPICDECSGKIKTRKLLVWKSSRTCNMMRMISTMMKERSLIRNPEMYMIVGCGSEKMATLKCVDT